MAVGVCAYLAAVYLTADAERAGQAALAERFRRRALGTGVAVGALALAGIGVLAADAPRLYQGLTGRALPLIATSAAFGLASLALLWRRRYLPVRVTAACAVVAVVWGWAVGQYPYMLEPDLTIAAAAAGRATLQAMLAALGVGAILLVPALAWLFILFQRTDPPRAAHTRHPQGW
jgi:cytochrome d ubiquinol oxidase subunit II